MYEVQSPLEDMIHKLNVCSDCAPKGIKFQAKRRGFCQKCSKESILMEIVESEDIFDDKYYHDIGGEA